MTAPNRLAQARAAWEPIVRDAGRQRRRRTTVCEGPWPGSGPASIWALSQVVQAAVDLTAVGVLCEIVILVLWLAPRPHAAVEEVEVYD